MSTLNVVCVYVLDATRKSADSNLPLDPTLLNNNLNILSAIAVLSVTVIVAVLYAVPAQLILVCVVPTLITNLTRLYYCTRNAWIRR
jgi:hypothetical protein